MTLNDLYEALRALPGHEKLVSDDYRLTMELYDPGNPSELHFYLTGPGTFYLFQTQIDQGDHRTVEKYSKDVHDEAEMRG